MVERSQECSGGHGYQVYAPPEWNLVSTKSFAFHLGRGRSSVVPGGGGVDEAVGRSKAQAFFYKRSYFYPGSYYMSRRLKREGRGFDQSAVSWTRLRF